MSNSVFFTRNVLQIQEHRKVKNKVVEEHFATEPKAGATILISHKYILEQSALAGINKVICDRAQTGTLSILMSP